MKSWIWITALTAVPLLGAAAWDRVTLPPPARPSNEGTAFPNAQMATLVSQWEVPHTPPPANLVNALDAEIQLRFRTIEGPDFGMTRVVTPETRLRAGHPTLRDITAAERKVLSAIRREGWEAMLVVAGRATRTPPTPEMPPVLNAKETPAGRLSVPVALTEVSAGRWLPPDAELTHNAKAAFAAAERNTSYQADAGDWSVVARPIRATKAECIGCHQRDADGTPLKKGDALGIALYAFTAAGTTR